jgi:hypothetical protein
MTVTTVEFADADTMPEALSVAPMVDMPPIGAAAATVTMPVALTVATLLLEEEKTSLDAVRAFVVPSL